MLPAVRRQAPGRCTVTGPAVMGAAVHGNAGMVVAIVFLILIVRAITKGGGGGW